MLDESAPPRRRLAPLSVATDLFPAMQRRKPRLLDPQLDQTRRELWRAYQRGTLSEEELASTLDRLESTMPTG